MDCQAVDLPADVGQLEQALMDFSPEDELSIRELMQAVRAMMKLDMPMDKPQDLYSLTDIVRLTQG